MELAYKERERLVGAVSPMVGAGTWEASVVDAVLLLEVMAN